MKNDRQGVYEGMCYIIPLSKLRETPKAKFFFVPDLVEEGISAVQRVSHEPGALSPSIEGEEESQLWYMHPHQEDNMMLMSGERIVELYTKEHGVQIFEATPEKLTHNGKVLIEGAYVFGWHTNVFHRPNSPKGSEAIFMTHHREGFDFETEFNIYSLNTETGDFMLKREGHLDQPNVGHCE
jgi:hypothetical protein